MSLTKARVQAHKQKTNIIHSDSLRRQESAALSLSLNNAYSIFLV